MSEWEENIPVKVHIGTCFLVTGILFFNAVII